MRRELVEFIEDHGDELCSKHPESFKKNGRLRRSARACVDTLEAIAEDVEGEYVARKFSWTLEKVEADRRIYTPPEEEVSDDSGGDENEDSKGEGEEEGDEAEAGATVGESEDRATPKRKQGDLVLVSLKYKLTMCYSLSECRLTGSVMAEYVGP